MENIIAILRGTRGIFFDTLREKENNIFYIGIENDKQNLRNDMLHFLSDFNTASKEAASKNNLL